MKRSTKSKQNTTNPASYAEIIFSELHGLVEIDRIPNSAFLWAFHYRALCDIKQVLQRTGMIQLNGPYIDLCNQNITVEYFPIIYRVLATLQAIDVDCRGNPYCEIDGYRYGMIFINPDLEKLDQSQIATAEPVTADRIVQAKSLPENAEADRGEIGADITEEARSHMDHADEDQISGSMRTHHEIVARQGTALTKCDMLLMRRKQKTNIKYSVGCQNFKCSGSYL
jgi:hypothetical protein